MAGVFRLERPVRPVPFHPVQRACHRTPCRYATGQSPHPPAWGMPADSSEEYRSRDWSGFAAARRSPRLRLQPEDQASVPGQRWPRRLPHPQCRKQGHVQSSDLEFRCGQALEVQQAGIARPEIVDEDADRNWILKIHRLVLPELESQRNPVRQHRHQTRTKRHRAIWTSAFCNVTR